MTQTTKCWFFDTFFYLSVKSQNFFSKQGSLDSRKNKKNTKMENKMTETEIRRAFSEHAVLVDFMNQNPNIDLEKLVQLLEPIRYAIKMKDISMNDITRVQTARHAWIYASCLEVPNYKCQKKTELVHSIIEKYNSVFKQSEIVQSEKSSTPSSAEMERQRIQAPLALGEPVQPDLFMIIDLSEITGKFPVSFVDKKCPKTSDLIRFVRQGVLHLYKEHFRNIKWYKDRFYEYDGSAKLWKWIESLDDVASLYYEILESNVSYKIKSFNDPFPFLSVNDKLKRAVLKETVKILSRSIKLASSENNTSISVVGSESNDSINSHDFCISENKESICDDDDDVNDDSYQLEMSELSEEDDENEPDHDTQNCDEKDYDDCGILRNIDDLEEEEFKPVVKSKKDKKKNAGKKSSKFAEIRKLHKLPLQSRPLVLKFPKSVSPESTLIKPVPVPPSAVQEIDDKKTEEEPEDDELKILNEKYANYDQSGLKLLKKHLLSIILNKEQKIRSRFFAGYEFLTEEYPLTTESRWQQNTKMVLEENLLIEKQAKTNGSDNDFKIDLIEYILGLHKKYVLIVHEEDVEIRKQRKEYLAKEEELAKNFVKKRKGNFL